jgi:hypothetical protein
MWNSFSLLNAKMTPKREPGSVHEARQEIVADPPAARGSR